MAKRRQGPPWTAIGVVFTIVTVTAMGAALFAKGGRLAPDAPGVCWRMTMQGTEPKFDPLSRDILNLETCAAHLERIHIMRGGEVQGAFQGRYIFIDDEKISSSASLEGSRWRVFFDPQRRDLDKKLKDGGKPPSVALMPAT